MSDATEAKSAKHLAEISHHLRVMNRILGALNANFVKAAMTFKLLVAMTEETESDLGDKAVETVLGEDESRRQRPDRFAEEDPHGEE
jgi:hypothetical protein